MTKLKEELERAGWEVSGESKTKGVFFCSGYGEIIWNLSNLWMNKEIQLTFYLIDPIGLRTKNLNDILYVKENKNELTLVFSKINTEEWKSDLKKFVRSLYPLKPAWEQSEARVGTIRDRPRIMLAGTGSQMNFQSRQSPSGPYTSNVHLDVTT